MLEHDLCSLHRAIGDAASGMPIPRRIDRAGQAGSAAAVTSSGSDNGCIRLPGGKLPPLSTCAPTARSRQQSVPAPCGQPGPRTRSCQCTRTRRRFPANSTQRVTGTMQHHAACTRGGAAAQRLRHLMRLLLALALLHLLPGAAAQMCRWAAVLTDRIGVTTIRMGVVTGLGRAGLGCVARGQADRRAGKRCGEAGRGGGKPNDSCGAVPPARSTP